MTGPLLAALLALPGAQPSVPAAAEAALSRAAALYLGAGAHVSSFVQTYTPAGFANARRESGEVWIQAPERLRFEYAAPEKKTFTFDDGEGRFYSPEDKQLTIKKLSAEERARLPIVFLTDRAELSRDYAISVEAANGEGDRLLLRPRAPRPELAWLRFSIGPDGAVRELSYEDDAGNRTEFRFEPWRAVKARPEEDYRVTGPKGTRVVEQ
ncbi:MAG: LolA family protein [Acidobacteriota bacterium]